LKSDNEGYNFKRIWWNRKSGSENIPATEINSDELLVEVKAFGLNPVDIKKRKGKGKAEKLKEKLPMILGWDIAGTVIETGKTSGKLVVSLE